MLQTHSHMLCVGVCKDAFLMNDHRKMNIEFNKVDTLFFKM